MTLFLIFLIFVIFLLLAGRSPKSGQRRNRSYRRTNWPDQPRDVHVAPPHTDPLNNISHTATSLTHVPNYSDSPTSNYATDSPVASVSSWDSGGSVGTGGGSDFGGFGGGGDFGGGGAGGDWSNNSSS